MDIKMKGKNKMKIESIKIEIINRMVKKMFDYL